MKEYVVIYSTDLHGSVAVYEKIFELAKSEKVKAIIIGGDVAPIELMASLHGVQEQRVFFESYLVPRLKEFRKEHKIGVFMILGNDDFSVNLDVIRKAEKARLLSLMHMKVQALKGSRMHIAGYPYINPTPFMMKDWERSESRIGKDLMAMSKKSDPKKTVYLIHAPPFKTNLDTLWDGRSVGSEGVRKFIEKVQPHMTLHGHIHESPEMTGSYVDKIGETLCINPGNNAIVLFDLHNPDSMERLKFI